MDFKSYELAWWEKLWYRGVLRLGDLIKDFPREVKWKWQRAFRGYADSDVWSLDGYLMEWLPSALRQLANNAHGCPPDLYDDETHTEDQSHKWVKILNEMADGFEAKRQWEEDYVKAVGALKDGKEYYDFDDPEWKSKYEAKGKEVEAALQHSLELFVKYFQHLWD